MRLSDIPRGGLDSTSTLPPMRDDPDAIRAATLQGHIIIVAPAAGLVTFLVIVTVIDIGHKAAGAADLPLPISPTPLSRLPPACFPCRLSYRALSQKQRQAIASGKSSPGFPVPPTPGKVLGRRDPTRRSARGVSRPAIIGAAMNEGAAFFALVAYLIEKPDRPRGGDRAHLVDVIARFPTAGRSTRVARTATGKTPRGI